MTQAVTFLQDFKLGHYMKIPPRTMFIAQSIWTCHTDRVFYDASIMGRPIGPRHTFGDEGVYGSINWFFLGDAIAPLLLWFARKAFPSKQWIKFINMPTLIGVVGMMPQATAINYTSWIIVGFLSGYVAYRCRPDLWKRYNYILSGALDAGLAFMGVLLYVCLGMENSLDWWGNDLDGCPYASCPTVKGVVVEDCPLVY